ncbi:PIG-L deacetylase family protein [Clostridium polynesiense]|uniref:PIG-L deacetylase family protein n=1 Tax=Clostridium polynesiense TaxID=1325933 RepID=UPI00058BC177|nr:PIG-L family deacetylase [Clostridium polynesiense]
MADKRIVMAIGGHVGDMELTAGGTLATMALQGHKIITVALTAGERGNPPTMTDKEYRVQKIQEAEKFAEMLGGEAVVLEHLDGELPDNKEVRLQVADLIRKYKPNVLITHWKNSMHKDHALTHRIVNDAQFFAGLPALERENPAHFAAGPYYAENWEDPTDFKPYVYSLISDEGFKLWSEAINHHWFALNSSSYKYKEYYSHLKAARGIEARKKYAETFDIDPIQKRIIKEGL